MDRANSPAQVADAELVDRAQAGASPAFAELVLRYQDRVHNLCYRMCGDHADALDLTQSTFLRALESLHGFERRANFFTWLFRIAVNLAISRRRQRRRRKTASLDGDGAEGGRPADALPDRESIDPAAALERRELHERLAGALAEMDEDFRAAVVLRDVEGLDYATIAEILDVPTGTVKSRIARGRTLLREALMGTESRLGPA